MAITPGSSALLEQLIAANALTQLNKVCVYPKVAVVGYENGAFTRGESVKIRRPKKRVAQDLNPRAGGATFTEAEFFSADVTLERLWTDGYPTYGHDPEQSIDLYVKETATQMADAIMSPNDSYMYSAFRAWDLPASGAVQLGAHPPIAIVASTVSGQLAPMNNSCLRHTETVFDRWDVPNGDRYVVLSAGAKGDFIGDGIVVSNGATNIPGNLNIHQEQFVRQGLPMATFTPRYNFQVAGSNSVQGQDAVTDLDTAAGVQGTLPIASIAANTQFSFADYATNNSKLIGAVDITLTVSTSLQGVAVGQIARIGTTGNAKAFGVILRVNQSTLTAPIITFVPYSPNGVVLKPNEIIAGTDTFSIPAIGSINTANHREGVLMATRMLKEPRAGSGARAASLRDTQTNLLIQIFSGQYDLTRVREFDAGYFLTGTKLSDSRKTALILTA